MFVIFTWICVLAISKFGMGDAIPSVIYSRTNENVTFQWRIPNVTMTSDIVITKKETNRIVFRLDVSNQSISDVDSLQKDRIKMEKIIGGSLTFTLIDVKLPDAGFYEFRQFNDVITEQLLVILEKPRKPVILSNATVLENTLKLYCLSVSQSRPEFLSLPLLCNWTRNGQNLKPGENKDFLFEDDYLIIKKDILLDNEVNLTCRCFEENGPVSEESGKAVFDLERASNGVYYWEITVTVICGFVFLMITIFFCLVYKKTRTGLFGFRKNRPMTVIYSQGNEVTTNPSPEIGRKAAAVLGANEIARNVSRRTSGKIVDITEDKVTFKVVVQATDTKI